MTSQNLRVVADNPRRQTIHPETHPLQHDNNRKIAQQQWDEIAHNLPVGESVSFTETTTRTISRNGHKQRDPQTADDWLVLGALIVVVACAVVGFLVLLTGGL